MNDKKTVRHIEVYTDDRYLFQKIRLLAPDGVSVTQGRGNSANPIRLVDVDTARFVEDEEFISMSRIREDADIHIPFSMDKISDVLAEGDKRAPALILSDSERCVYLHGEKIRLTEVEYLLMSTLAHEKGGYVSREELLIRVWGGETEPGVLNVYIHYLREKLEACGEKIILSSRKCGYKISEKYLLEEGESNAQNN